MKEFLHYLKGIKKEDIDKIPIRILKYFEENADSKYICDFDYNKPLKELNLKKETIALINMICFKYWCKTQKEKTTFLNILNKNELKNQEELNTNFNYDSIFKRST